MSAKHSVTNSVFSFSKQNQTLPNLCVTKSPREEAGTLIPMIWVTGADEISDSGEHQFPQVTDTEVISDSGDLCSQKDWFSGSLIAATPISTTAS
ncbi:hypothetical protein HHK36_022560 [Tetracentron sinense]|uniref:Uncharacterized protein n=1 Tax=Tetracentron sinense TaxID=13715 RepID=A0A835D6F3_TETSI|nr:hypothetical protein HHK36_022560 [Tetracentron sinense]